MTEEQKTDDSSVAMQRNLSDEAALLSLNDSGRSEMQDRILITIRFTTNLESNKKKKKIVILTAINSTKTL